MIVVKNLSLKSLMINSYTTSISKIQIPHWNLNGIRKRSCEQLMDPTNKVAIVVGGVSGTGFATAKELLANKGKHVVITDTKTDLVAVEELSRKYGTAKVSFHKLDQQDPQNYEEIFCYANKYGGADILVNTEEVIKDKQLEYEININLKGAIQGTLLAMKYAKQQSKIHGVVVVNLTSTYGLDGFPFIPIYAATNAGVIGFSRAIGDYGVSKEGKIRVIALSTGIIESKELIDIKYDQLNKRWGRLAFDCVNKKQKEKPHQVAKAVLYVIQYGLTGTVWSVEGGHLFKTYLPDRNAISSVVKRIC